MSDHVGIQSKKTTTATSTPLTVIPPTRGFTPPTHDAQLRAKTQAPTQEVEPPSSKQETPDLQTQLERASRCGHNFGRMQARIERPSVFQPKLTIGQPGDKYEQEADRVADSVMAMPVPTAQPKIQRQSEDEELQTKFSDSIPPSIQLQVEEEEQVQAKVDALAPLIQRQEASQEDEQLQTKPLQQESAPTNSTQDSPTLESRLTAQQGSGSPLSKEARAFMEPRFGADFSQVKIHTNSSAVQMNKELSAQAFTHGNDIYFGAGKYNPGTSDGKQLLAHELTHVVQQTGAKQLQRQPITDLRFNQETPHKIQPSPALHSPQCATIQRFQENPQSQTPGDNKANKDRKTPNSASATAKSNTSGSGAAPTLTQKRENVAATAPAKEKGDKRDGNAIARAQEGSESSGIAKAAKAQSGSNATSAKLHSDNSGAVPDNTGANVSAPGTKNAQLKSPASPQEDPAFQSVVNQAKGVAKQEKQHDSAQAESKEAQDAAQPPGNEVESKAQDRQVGEMNQQQPGAFNATAFKAALMQKIAAVIPNNEQDAKKFKESNQLDSVKQDMSSQVTQEQEQAAGPIEEKAKEAPNTSGIEPKQVTPLQPPNAGAAPTDIGAQQATPKPKPESEVSAPLKANSQELDQQMTEAHITEEQLEKSNESQFQETLGAKKEAQANAVEVPQAYRQSEQTTLTKAQAEAQTTSQTQLQGMHGGRQQMLTQVMGAQSETQGKDTQERAKIAGEINGIYEETKGKVENVLSSIDIEVKTKFDTGAAAAKQKFEAHVGKEMAAWEQKRYGEWYDVTGWDERVSDAWLGLPPEVNEFFVAGRQLYLDSMDVTLTEIANFVAQKLNEAKQKIAEGKQKIQERVAGLPENLKQVGQEAAQNIQEKFKQLEESVNSKQDELIDSLAQKYSDSLQQLDADIEKRKEANRGLKDKAKDALAGTIQTIMQLKDMLMGVLAKAAGAIDKIILDPIAFLGNLVAGVKQGFMNFAGNIWQHLKKGLLGWLTGTLAAGGIQMPESFDLKGIFTLVMQVLGLAYDAIKSRAVKALGKNGEKIFTALETTFEIFIILKNEGLAGLWKFIQDKIGDLKVMVIDTIQTFVIENVIKQGVLWVISLLNPASAFVKACKMIYDIIMFFIERGSQIVELVNAVMESVSAIAFGAVGGAAKMVENALATSLPVVISFMASLLGLGGISEKIQGIIKQVRAPIDQAIDWLIAQAVQFAKKIGNKLGFGKDEKNKDGKEETDTDQVITESFSMAGESHTLKVTLKGNDIEAVMASIPRSIQQALNEQKQTEQDLINSTSGAEKQKHVTILSQLTGIEAWYSAELTKIRGLPDKTKIGPGIKALADQLKQKIVVLGNTYGLKDFVYKSLGIHELFSTIQGQVKELRKHLGGGTGDGHNNTATAAEILGWIPPFSQRHDTRTRTAEPILTDAINKLDDIQRNYGVVVSTELDYLNGKMERDDCRKALSDPIGYLATKGYKVVGGKFLPLQHF